MSMNYRPAATQRTPGSSGAAERGTCRRRPARKPDQQRDGGAVMDLISQ